MKTSESVWLPAACLAIASTTAASAKSVTEAIADMAALEGEDPQGFSLMIACILILFTCASALMLFTGLYMYRPGAGKETRKDR